MAQITIIVSTITFSWLHILHWKMSYQEEQKVIKIHSNTRKNTYWKYILTVQGEKSCFFIKRKFTT
jgi:hypothetical protein